MPTCELCGKDSELTKAKVSGAELRVCSECAELGTTIGDNSEDSSTSTKYSTSSSKSSTSSESSKNNRNTGTKSTGSSSSSSNQSRKTDYDDISELVFNYGEIIKDERNERGMNRDELAKELGIKSSHLRNIEDETTQPNVDLQKKIESFLDIELTMGDIDY